MQVLQLFVLIIAVSATRAFRKPVLLDGPVAELNVAAVEISNATATIQSAANLAPDTGRDQAAAAVLLELEQHAEDLAQEVHGLWVNASGRRKAPVGALRAKAVDPKSHASTSVAALERSGSIIVNTAIVGAVRGNLTVEEAGELDKPGSKKGKSIPGLQNAMAVVLKAMQHVQSAARSEQLGNGGEDLAPTAELVMDRSRELYSAVEIATARVAGGKDAQTRAEGKLEKIQQRVSKQSADLGSDGLAMTRELRLVKHAVREAVGGSTRRDVQRNARDAMKDSREDM